MCILRGREGDGREGRSGKGGWETLTLTHSLTLHTHTHTHETHQLASLFAVLWLLGEQHFLLCRKLEREGSKFPCSIRKAFVIASKQAKKKKGAFSTPQANPNKKPTRAHKQQHSTVCPQKRSKPNSLLLTACLLSFPQKKREHFHLSCPIVPQRTHSPFLLAVLDTFPSVSVCVCACACLWCCCWFSVLPAFFLSCVLFRCTFSPTPLLPPTTPNKPTSTTTH